MKTIKLLALALVFICLVGLASQNCPANEHIKYLDAVHEFSDNVLNYGRDVYGPNEDSMVASQCLLRHDYLRTSVQQTQARTKTQSLG